MTVSSVKKHFFLFIICTLLILCIALTARASENKTSDSSIGFLKINDDTAVLDKLNIPQPVEESCPHIILNKNENIYLRVTLKPESAKRFLISSLHLAAKDEYYNTRRNMDMLLLTGVSLKDLETSKGIKLGSTIGQIRKAYGKPEKTIVNKAAGTETIVYENKQDGTTTIFILKKGRTQAVIIK